MRSLIQLAGRVRRHRSGAVGGVNMVVLDSNLRHFKTPGQPAYEKPGFETAHAPFQLKSHYLHDLLSREVGKAAAWAVDAQPRIALPTDKLIPSRRWTDLEHARMHDSLLPKPPGTATPTHAACLQWHEPQPDTPRSLWLTGLLPQFQRFRQDDQKRDDVALLPNEEEEMLLLHRVQDGERRYEKVYVPIHQSLCHPVPAAQLASPSVSPWPQVGLMEELAALAQAQDSSLEQCVQRYATASLPESQAGWWWDERLGFTKKA